MRTKPIRRDEVRFNGYCITTMPANSVRKRRDSIILVEPIPKLWVPLLRSLNRVARREWAAARAAPDRFPALTALLGPQPKKRKRQPITVPLPAHWGIYGGVQTCRHCGREFYRTHSSGHTYCSDKCAAAAHSVFVAKHVKARSEERAAERAKWNDTCETCGKPIKARRSTMKFCSIRCRVAAHRLAKG
jgi:hypothetical protein